MTVMLHRSMLLRPILPCALVLTLVGCAITIRDEPPPDRGNVAAAGVAPSSARLDDAANAATDDEDASEPETITARTTELERRAGFLVLHVDRDENTVLLELDPPQGDAGLCLEFLLGHGLRRGLGSNPVGLDRGQLSGTDLVRVRRLGTRVLFERPNLRFRALDGDAAAERAVDESFATSVIWGTEAMLVEESGRALVDLGPFLHADHHGLARTLSRASDGSYRIDDARSVLELGDLKVFPDNVEAEATLTFTTDGNPGREVASTAPDGRAVTLVQHLSFVRLPDDGYRTRFHDPRTGSFALEIIDATAPLERGTAVRLAERHRLAPGDTLTYYVDPGAPEPVRSALLEGARWWADAFDAAGFPGAFRVELLPEGVDPLDVRYSVIQWVHRETRGWSYGAGITDPRTGEILKGHVTLGSLRVRQDRLLFEGLLGADQTGTGSPTDPIVLSLARIRQLAAHEVGHTLGLAHNFAASTQDRASVMDYPPPRVTVAADGALDVSEAYGVGVGAWDRHAIRWLYGVFGAGDDGSIDPEAERAELAAVVAEGIEAGLLYLSDADSRAPGASDPRGSLWDDGPDAVAALENAGAVRAVALERFGPRNLAAGEPRAHLHEVFAPVYFHHRYALDAAVKTVGGVEYAHGLRGDGVPTPRVIPRERQEAALEAVLATIAPEFLRIPSELLPHLPPRAPQIGRNRELLTGDTDPIFDPIAAARTAAALAVDGLLVEERLARLVTQSLDDPEALSIETVLRRLTDTFVPKEEDDRAPAIAALDEAVERVILDRLMARAGSATVPPAVRTAIDGMLGELLARLGPPYESRRLRFANAHRAEILRDLERHLARSPAERVGITPPAPPPPGSPIGCDCGGF